MPPTITNKVSLGSLFGGWLASINYNFQTASQPSTATLTVVSENNSFVLPSFNEQVSIPPFNLQMVVRERGVKKDGQYKTLQIELVELASEIIDKELVLIYGEHTDLEFNLDNELYYSYPSFFIPKHHYHPGTVFNESIKFPNFQENYIKNHGDGINVIGTARATFLNSGSQNVTGSSDIKGEPRWITFENGRVKDSVSNWIGQFYYTPDLAGDIAVAFGYTLKNLFLLFKSKGLSFDAKSESLMQDENIFFSEAGPMREVLASCLAKIGRSFYIDPFSQKIVIITNSDIARINNNLIEKFSQFDNVKGATQVSLKESVNDVSAVHFVTKGDLDFTDNDNNSEKKDPRARKQVFYKLDRTSLDGDLTDKDVILMKMVAPLVYNISDTETLDKYIYALGLLYDTANWGDLYGYNEYYPGPFEQIEKDTNPDDYNPPPWQAALINNPSAYFEAGPYRLPETVGARELKRDSQTQDGLTSVVPALGAGESNFYQYVKDFSQLWAGTYFSAPMTESQVNSRVYAETAKWAGGSNNSFEYVRVKGDAYIREVPELQFLSRLLQGLGRAPANPNYTVKDVAEKASGKKTNSEIFEGPIGSGEYYVIGFRKLFSGSHINFEQIQKEINKHFFSFYHANAQKKYLVYTKRGQDIIKIIESLSSKAFEEERKKVKKKLIVNYTKVAPDEDPDEDDETDVIVDSPDLFSIRNIASNVQNFGSRSLSVLQNRYSEMKLFLANIQDLNPEFSGPLITTQIDYFRPPTLSDFDIESGVESVSVSIGNNGITTSVLYSARKFAQIDLSVVRDFLGGNSTSFFKKLYTPSFRKNVLKL